MSKARTKQFTLSDVHQLGLVDRWWAGLLHGGMKELLKVEWEALGEMVWLLRVHWKPLPGKDRLNVGHPRYAGIPTDRLEDVLTDALGEFESAFSDYTSLSNKVEQWGLYEEPLGGEFLGTKLVFGDQLDEAEKMISLEYLWPQFQQIQKYLAYLTAQMNELDQEIKARKAPDYFTVNVDRGMLREAFLDQVGYDNEWLFADANGPFPHVEE